MAYTTYSLPATLANFEDRLRNLEKGSNSASLQNSAVIGTSIGFFDDDGTPRAYVGAQNDGTYAIIYGNGPKPPVPTAPTVTAMQLGFAIGWDGEFAGGVARPADVARVDVHMSEDSGFVPNGNTVIGSLMAEGVCSVNADVTQKYFKMVAVTTSDVASDPTDGVAKTALPAGQLAAGSVTAETIQAGAIKAEDILVSGSITANMLASNLVLGSRIISGETSGGRVEMNTTGLQAYHPNGRLSWQVTRDGQMEWFDPTDSSYYNRSTIDVAADGKMSFRNKATDLKTMEFDASGNFNVYNPAGKTMLNITNQGLFQVFSPDTGYRTFAVKSDGQVYASRNVSGVETPTFVIDKNGDVLITGRYRTGISGARMEIFPSWTGTGFSGSGQISFYSPSEYVSSIYGSSYTKGTTQLPAIYIRTQERPDGWFGMSRFGGPSFSFTHDCFNNNFNNNGLTSRAALWIDDTRVFIKGGTRPVEANYGDGNWCASLNLPSEGNPFTSNNAAPHLVSQYRSGSTSLTCGVTFDSRNGYAAVLYNDGGLHVDDWRGNFANVYARDFIKSSTVQAKEDFQEMPDSPLEVLRQAPSTLWSYKDDPDHNLQAGPIAEDLPSWLTTEKPPVMEPGGETTIEEGIGRSKVIKGAGDQQNEIVEDAKPNAAVGLGSMMGVLWEAIRELDREVDELRAASGVELPERITQIGESKFNEQ